MGLTELLRVALRALGANALRSILTTLGIIIGVASVIVMVAVGEGARNEVERQIASLGTNVLQVQTGSSRVRSRAAGSGTRLPFSDNDVQAIKDSVRGVAAVSGVLSTAATVVHGSTNWMTTIDGVGADYAEVRDWETRLGRFFVADEERSARKVAVIGNSAATQLFGDQDPIGAKVRIGNVPFEIVGLLEPKGQSTSGRDQDDVLLVPASAARGMLTKHNKLVPRHVTTIIAKVADDSEIDEAKREVEEVMRKRRRAQANGEDDFFVRDLADYLRTRNAAQQTLGLLLGATAAISLIVGGIGIMNIMLVSVSERTREIGLRMAIGARRKDILRQFLSEAVLLCMLGGLVGVVLGVVATRAIAAYAEWPVFLTPPVMLLALGAAALTGICFGFLPARRAARLSPIEALRSE